jgi:hypothetical protein
MNKTKHTHRTKNKEKNDNITAPIRNFPTAQATLTAHSLIPLAVILITPRNVHCF